MNTAHASHPVTIEKLNEIWHFQAGPLFKEFTTLLADPEKTIPAQNLQAKWELGLHWNPILSSFAQRPTRIALSTLSTTAKNTI